MDPLTSAQRDALVRLARFLDDSTYLAGGVAVALHLGHRQSRDLDLFTPSADPNLHTERLAALEPEARITSQSEGTLYLELRGVPASWIRYRYPLLASPERMASVPVPVASRIDLVCMKLSAIASRGAARDFWDLHALLTASSLTLSEALAAFARKYAAIDCGHVVKSLVYFADAEAAPLPMGLQPAQWESIKKDLTSWVAPL